MLAHSPVLRRHFAPLRTREAGIPGGILPHPDIPFFGQKREILDREAQRPGGPGTARTAGAEGEKGDRLIFRTYFPDPPRAKPEPFIDAEKYLCPGKNDPRRENPGGDERSSAARSVSLEADSGSEAKHPGILNRQDVSDRADRSGRVVVAEQDRVRVENVEHVDHEGDVRLGCERQDFLG